MFSAAGGYKAHHRYFDEFEQRWQGCSPEQVLCAARTSLYASNLDEVKCWCKEAYTRQWPTASGRPVISVGCAAANWPFTPWTEAVSFQSAAPDSVMALPNQSGLQPSRHSSWVRNSSPLNSRPYLAWSCRSRTQRRWVLKPQAHKRLPRHRCRNSTKPQISPQVISAMCGLALVPDDAIGCARVTLQRFLQQWGSPQVALICKLLRSLHAQQHRLMSCTAAAQTQVRARQTIAYIKPALVSLTLTVHLVLGPAPPALSQGPLWFRLLGVECTSCLYLTTSRLGLTPQSWSRLFLHSLCSATMDPLHDDVLEEALADNEAADAAATAHASDEEGEAASSVYSTLTAAISAAHRSPSPVRRGPGPYGPPPAVPINHPLAHAYIPGLSRVRPDALPAANDARPGPVTMSSSSSAGGPPTVPQMPGEPDDPRWQRSMAVNVLNTLQLTGPAFVHAPTLATVHSWAALRIVLEEATEMDEVCVAKGWIHRTSPIVSTLVILMYQKHKLLMSRPKRGKKRKRQTPATKVMTRRTLMILQMGLHRLQPHRLLYLPDLPPMDSSHHRCHQ